VKKVLGLEWGKGLERSIEPMDAGTFFKSASLREKKRKRWTKLFIIVRENMILLNSKAIFTYGQIHAWTLFSESLV
jgi:hypothetical protein